MPETIAERRLSWAKKGDPSRSEFVIRIGAPFVVEPGSVDFPVSEGTGACRIEFVGFPVAVEDTVYGADTVQALQLAIDVDPLLKRFSDRYDIYFPTGEPYFEE
jgi:hypothetical protein